MALLQKAYLGATPLFKERSWFEDVSAKPVSESSTVTITADASSHVKGAWSQLIASTAGNSTYIIVEVGGNATAATDNSGLLDIGIGASGSETAIINNVPINGATAGVARVPFAFGVPIKIASGTRIAARFQSLVSSKTATVLVRVFDMGDYAYAPTTVDTIGADTAASTGISMSGASGTWVQMTSSTTNAYKAFVVIGSWGGGTVVDNIRVQYTLGVGASASETELGSMQFQTVNDETCGIEGGAFPVPIAATVAAGSRLAIKHNISANSTRYRAVVLGIR
jgi:hypothetical protein